MAYSAGPYCSKSSAAVHRGANVTSSCAMPMHATIFTAFMCKAIHCSMACKDLRKSSWPPSNATRQSETEPFVRCHYSEATKCESPVKTMSYKRLIKAPYCAARSYRTCTRLIQTDVLGCHAITEPGEHGSQMTHHRSLQIRWSYFSLS
jgi:hypothetical protein